MKRNLRLWMWGTKLVAAFSASGATRIVREYYGSASGSKIVPVTGSVEYVDQDGSPLGTVNAEDCSSVWPIPMIVPDLY